MPATSAVEGLAVLATILLVLRLAMPDTGTVEKLAMLAMILLMLRLAMPVPPCWLFLPAMLVTLCRPCRSLLAGHSLPVMLVTLCGPWR